MTPALAFCDTPDAVEKCRNFFPQAILATDNPLLAEAQGIHDASAFVQQEEATRLGEGIIDALLQLDNLLSASDIDRRFGLLTPRLNLTLALRATAASMLIRGLMAARMQDAAGRPVGKVILAGSTDGRWQDAHPWSLPRFGMPTETLARHGFFGDTVVERLPVNFVIPNQVGDVPTDDFASRLMITPVPLLAFELVRRLGLNGLAPGRDLYVGKSAENLREALPWLLVRGFRLHHYKMPGYSPVTCPPGHAPLPVDPWIEAAARPVFENAVSDVFTKEERTAYAGAILEHMQAGLQATAASIPQINEAIIRIAGKSPGAAILTGGVYGPIATNFHTAARQHGIHIVDFEHGATTGIARTAQRRLEVSEATTSDLLIAGAPRAARAFSQANPDIDIVIAGSPDQTRRLLRRRFQRWRTRQRLGISRTEQIILHVSGFVLGGNMRFGDDFPVEANVFDNESRLLREVYADLPSRVLYKPYPAIRMPYQPGPDRRLSLARNIVVVPREDFRYIRAAADVIVTEASMSTLGWCLGTHLPFVHLQSRNVNALADDGLYRDFADSFFVIDMDRPDWPRDLRAFLLRPLQDIQEEWAAKAKHRREFLQDAFDGPPGNMGRRAADGIARYLARCQVPGTGAAI